MRKKGPFSPQKMKGKSFTQNQCDLVPHHSWTHTLACRFRACFPLVDVALCLPFQVCIVTAVCLTWQQQQQQLETIIILQTCLWHVSHDSMTVRWGMSEENINVNMSICPAVDDVMSHWMQN